MRGRKPKPIELKLVAGNPGGRPLPEAAVRLAGFPDAPPGLGETELAEWSQVVQEMSDMGTLSRDNAATIEVHIRSLCRMRAAEAHVGEHGVMVAAPRTGLPMQNPHLRIAQEAAAIVLKTAAELGLTPSARGRVGAIERAKQSPIARKYLTGVR